MFGLRLTYPFHMQEEDHNSNSSSHEYTDNTAATKAPKVTSNATNSVKNISQDPKIEDAKLTEESSASKVNDTQNEKSDSEASSPSSQKSVDNIHTSRLQKSATYTKNGSSAKFRNRSSKATSSMRKPTKWGRTSVSTNFYCVIIFPLVSLKSDYFLYSDKKGSSNRKKGFNRR